MADNDAYLRLRRMTGEVDLSVYTNTDLDLFLQDAGGDLNVAAALIWGEKASSYADLVNISEAGSSRNNSDLFKHAKEQQAYFSGLGGVEVDASVTPSTTRRIVRR
jgi:hypothetical protein